MAPDRGGSTATLNPQSTVIPDPILSRGTLSAIIEGDKQILASTTCMRPELEAEEGALVICIPISNHATNSSTNKCSRTVCRPIALNQTQKATAPVGKWRPSRNLQTQLVMKKMENLGIGSIAVTSNTSRDNQGVLDDSACSEVKVHHHHHHSTAIHQHNHSYSTPHQQRLSQCTDINERGTRLSQTILKQTNSQNSPQSTNIEARDGSGTCKYTNRGQCTVKQNFPKRYAYHDAQNSQRYCTYSDVWRSSGASHTHLDCPIPFGEGEGPVSNWLRVVNSQVEGPASLYTEESWPPLLACQSEGETSGSQSKNLSTSCVHSQNRMKSRFAAKYKCKDVVLLSDLEYQSNSYSSSLFGKPESQLDEQSWPTLEKSSKQSVLCDAYGSERKRRTLQHLVSSNSHYPQAAHTMQHESRKGQYISTHGGFHKTEKLHIAPRFLMLNKDFIVTSPLKENLLLTLALMGKRSDVEAPESFQGQSTEGETKRQILVGQFKAFSSYLHFLLGHDATRVRRESNAGGTSTISESLSVEYFVRRFQAKDIVTEMEVEYRSFNWKKVDFICTLYGQRVGVSVTRAMSFPDPKDFSVQMAYRLLYKKLFGLVVARHGVSKRHSFSQCILHVWCETQQAAHMMQTEYDGVSQELDIADDVVMVLTVADGCHTRPIFYESLLRNP